ncbi:diguanylate cyclase [Vibrio sp. JPW-9-11-11]|uniref:diguanylate cyclase domain-containing protein n=1 Tax=Vibrio sp. JPW-9-11-11 TaxID=1416532 RepID=UPI00159471AB|nr:diguanylate cyclase [Vibrio sp. JPW-9-11-11]NVD07713.1 diguanylate cyclase [Vibrio sp. JPW-9-11-11]
MLDSMFKKMFVLSTTTMLLTLFIVVSFTKIHAEHKSTKIELDQVIDLQLSVDLLRSQLWAFMQFRDKPSLEQVEMAQAELDTKLTAYKHDDIQLDNLQRMNTGLLNLIEQEKSLFLVHPQDMSPALESALDTRGLLQSRYNMIVQNMTEELAYIHKQVLNNNTHGLQQVMRTAAVWLIACSLLVSGVAWLILFRFKSGAGAIKQAILNLASGQLDTKVEEVQMDSEFKVISSFFNQMTVSLRQSTVTKQELEEEVKRQTKQLQSKQEQLLFLSEHDPLTNLMNRRAFDKQVESALVKANRTERKLAIMFLDLDGFKQVNDTYGHNAGDLVLTTVARRLEECIRESDFIGRLGGDEFVVCLDLLTNFDIVARKVEQIQQAIHRPIHFNDRTLQVSVSIGVSYYPDDSKNKETLMSLADEAMYRTKEQPIKQTKGKGAGESTTNDINVVSLHTSKHS